MKNQITARIFGDVEYRKPLPKSYIEKKPINLPKAMKKIDISQLNEAQSLALLQSMKSNNKITSGGDILDFSSIGSPLQTNLGNERKDIIFESPQDNEVTFGETFG